MQLTIKTIYSILISLALSLSVFAGNPVDDFAKSPLLENANVSLLVRDLNTGQTLYEYRPRSLAIPASTMKLVSTATALEVLGADFRLKTALGIDGEVTKDSILRGNLYIRGGGDPTLGSEKLGDINFLANWVAVVKLAGINRIEGKIIADASLYDDEGVNPHWTWEDIGNYYAAGAYGIAYADNTCRVVLRSGAEGTKPEVVRTFPEINGLRFDNCLKSTKISFDSAYFYGAPHSNWRTIRGEIPANKTEFVTKCDIPNPALLLAEHFQQKLLQNGVTTTGQFTDTVPSNSHDTIIYTHESPLLSDIVAEINIHSNNLYAEQIFRYLGQGDSIRATSVRAARAVQAYWKSKGFATDQLCQYDGSGLSPEDAVSAQFYVELLTYMSLESKNKDVFFKSLPIAGESGTLSTLLKKTPLQGKVHAKSGTISRVKCYAGYITTTDKNYAFAIMVNNANGSSRSVVKKMEEFLLAITK